MQISNVTKSFHRAGQFWGFCRHPCQSFIVLRSRIGRATYLCILWIVPVDQESFLAPPFELALQSVLPSTAFQPLRRASLLCLLRQARSTSDRIDLVGISKDPVAGEKPDEVAELGVTDLRGHLSNRCRRSVAAASSAQPPSAFLCVLPCHSPMLQNVDDRFARLADDSMPRTLGGVRRMVHDERAFRAQRQLICCNIREHVEETSGMLDREDCLAHRCLPLRALSCAVLARSVQPLTSSLQPPSAPCCDGSQPTMHSPRRH